MIPQEFKDNPDLSAYSCPRCLKPAYYRKGQAFEHEKICGYCNIDWDPNDVIEFRRQQRVQQIRNSNMTQPTEEPKRYDSVIEMAYHIDPELGKDVEERVEARKLIKTLLIERIRQDIDSIIVARACSASVPQLAKYEFEMYDHQIPLGILQKYAEAVGMKLSVALERVSHSADGK